MPTLKESFEAFRDKCLSEVEKLWGPIDDKNEPMEKSIEKENWLKEKIDPEISMLDHELKNVQEPDMKKVKIFENKLEGWADLGAGTPYQEWGLYNYIEERKRMYSHVGKAVSYIKKKHFSKVAKEEDEVWEWSTPAEFWACLAGRGGYALVRDGKVIAQVITRLN